MEEIGIVREIKNNQAKVEVIRRHSCHKCGACEIGGSRVFELWLDNAVNAKPGDRVIIYFAGKKLLKVAFIVYIFPLIALMAGYIAGAALFPKSSYGEIGGIIASFVFFTLSLAAIFFYDRKTGKNKAYHPKICKIMEEK